MASVSNAIEEQVLKWPASKRIKLAEKLMASIEGFATPDIEAAWNKEIEARVEEIRDGREEGIPAEVVMKEARKKLRDRISRMGSIAETGF